MTDINTLMW